MSTQIITRKATKIVQKIKFHFPVLLIALGMFIITSNLNWGKDHWKTIIKSDGKGYYAYLPAVFIYHDLNFAFFDKIEKEKYFNPNLYYDYRSGHEGKTINKYYCGTALTQMPFFMIAHGLSVITEKERDGYSAPYAISISLAALFYLILGLIYLNKLLELYDINQINRLLTLVASVFGTHLFYYTVGEPGMSHVYSFGFVCMFMYYSKKYFNTLHTNYLFSIAATLGIIILIRPVNALVIFTLPFLAENQEVLKKALMKSFSEPFKLIGSSLLCLSFLFIQILIYKISTGDYWVYSYLDEGFNFLKPNMLNILFSFRKGLFLYTPMLMLSFGWIFFAGKQSRTAIFFWLAFFLLITYVFSSWWMWYYGGSFSSRVYVEYIGVFMIPLALMFHQIKNKLLYSILVCSVVTLIFLCQLQTYQYRYYLIHWSDMNKEKYWDAFLRIK